MAGGHRNLPLVRRPLVATGTGAMMKDCTVRLLGTFRTWRDVQLVSGMCTKAAVRRPLQIYGFAPWYALREILDFARPLAVYAIQSIFAVDRYAACSWPCRARRYSIAAKASKILRICGAL